MVFLREGLRKKEDYLKGDIVIQLGDSIVTDMMSYMRALSVFDTGDKTTVMVKRGNKESSFRHRVLILNFYTKLQ